MPAEKGTGIVIRAVDFSETSQIVTLFTREHGKLSGIAKGGRRPKGSFESALDLLALVRIVFLRKSSDALDLLTEAKLLRRFRPFGRDLFGLYVGYYVAELLDALTEDYHPNGPLFDLAEETLALLADGEEPRRLLARFELQLLFHLGLAPSLEQCADCGAAVAATGKTALGLLDGGVLCDRCKQGKRHVAVVHGGTLRTMRQLIDTQSGAWRRVRIDARTQGEIRGVLNRYMSHLLGRRPRLLPYLRG